MNSLEAQLSCSKCSKPWAEQVEFCPYCGTKNLLDTGKKDATQAAPVAATVSVTPVAQITTKDSTKENEPIGEQDIRQVDKPQLPKSKPYYLTPGESAGGAKQADGPIPDPGGSTTPVEKLKQEPKENEARTKSSSSWVWIVALVAIAALAGSYFSIFKKTGGETEHFTEPPPQIIICPGDPACPKPPKAEPPTNPQGSLPPAAPPVRPPSSQPPAAPPSPPKIEQPITNPENDALLSKAENLAGAGNYQEAARTLNACTGRDNRCVSKRGQYERLAESSYDCMYSGGSWNVGRRTCN